MSMLITSYDDVTTAHSNIANNTIEHKSCCRHSSCILILEATKYKALNEEDEDSNTALHLASMKGHLGIVELLINHGADKMARSAGAFAAASDVSLMSVLHGCTCVCFGCRNVNQWTPLDFASAEGHVDVVKHLLSEDVPVNPMDKEKV